MGARGGGGEDPGGRSPSLPRRGTASASLHPHRPLPTPAPPAGCWLVFPPPPQQHSAPYLCSGDGTYVSCGGRLQATGVGFPAGATHPRPTRFTAGGPAVAAARAASNAGPHPPPSPCKRRAVPSAPSPPAGQQRRPRAVAKLMMGDGSVKTTQHFCGLTNDNPRRGFGGICGPAIRVCCQCWRPARSCAWQCPTAPSPARHPTPISSGHSCPAFLLSLTPPPTLSLPPTPACRPHHHRRHHVLPRLFLPGQPAGASRAHRRGAGGRGGRGAALHDGHRQQDPRLPCAQPHRPRAGDAHAGGGSPSGSPPPSPAPLRAPPPRRGWRAPPRSTSPPWTPG